MNMPVKAIKSLLGKELQGHYSAACQTIYSDIQRGFVHIGYKHLKAMLESAETYEQIEEVLSEADYGMSLQEWIDSL